MKKTYCNLELSFVALETQDVITASSWENQNDVNGDDRYDFE